MSASATTATLQTPPGRGGIAVILLAGPDAGRALSKIFRPLPSHRQGGNGILQLGHLLAGDEIIDEAVVHFRGPDAEINIHGGPAVTRRVMELLAEHGAVASPARPAAPQTFPPTHPARDNPAIGRELLEALPRARSARVAATLTQQWSAGISELAGRLVRGESAAPVELRGAAEGLVTMRRLLEPAEVVLAGPPNAGKSTLVNLLVGREVSIVHDTPGTTRDWVRELALLDGLPIWLTDTAGLWDPPEGIDAEAVRRARQRVDDADLVLLLETAEAFAAPDWLHARRILRVATQCDLARPTWEADVAVSAHTGQGLDELQRRVLDTLGLGDFDPGAPRAFTQRQADLLTTAAEAIDAGDVRAVDIAMRQMLREGSCEAASGLTV